MNISNIVSDILNSMSFLSRLPIGPLADRLGVELKTDFDTQAWTFPITGFLIALPAAIALLVSSAIGLNPFIGVGIAMAILTLSTGGLHEDGLADVADGLGGGKTNQAKLEIMRDSTIGSYGALALMFSILLQWAGLVSIAQNSSALTIALAICLISGASRAAMLWPWVKSEPARDGDSLSKSMGRPTSDQLKISSLIGGGFIILLGIFMLAPINTVIAILLAGVAIIEFTKLCERQLGGHTGDTLGATQQICATLLIVALSIN